MRKLISIMVMLAVFCLVIPIVRTSADYRDLPKTYTFYDDIKYLTEKKIISGYPDGMFLAISRLHVNRLRLCLDAHWN